MSQNPDSNSSPGRSLRGPFILVVLAVLGLGYFIPPVREAMTNLLHKALPKDHLLSEQILSTIRDLIKAELSSQPLPGMKFDAAVHIIPTGLTNDLRATWHRTAEGSDAFPVALFRALDDPKTGRPLIESFASYGLIASPDDDTGLPVGFSRIKAQEHDFVLTGINCAACHSTQITYRGKTLHIDGAPNLLDVEAFFRGVLGALEGALKSKPSEKAKFLLRFAYYNAIEIEKMVAAGELDEAPTPYAKTVTDQHDHTLAFLEGRLRGAALIIRSFDQQTAAGPGRADSFGIMRNLIMTEKLLGAAGNFQPMTAPVSMPHLFRFGSFTNLHWDGNTTTGTDRNYAQAIALGASFDPVSKASSVRPYGLYVMESAGRELTPPKWPAEIFGPLDAAKVARGAALYRSENCGKCHGKETWTPLDIIGTDPNRLVNYALPVNVKGGRTETYATNLYTSAIAVKRKAYEDNSVPLPMQKEMDEWHEGVVPAWLETLDKGYFTRPLRGLWTTAPYLHNGSVPSLWDLLQPEDKRPKKFAVGHREFDPQRVGYAEQPEKIIWELDTSLSGNHNTGHGYGTRLTDAQKWDLVEYLKTL